MLAERDRLEALASYVPRMVLRHLASKPAPTRTERSSAALMLVDITGFTPLTSTLSDRGAGGTEQLSRALNTYIGRIIDLVEEHGGDIAKIVGDAVLAVWADDEPVATAARRAVWCGLAIARTLSDLEVARDVRLSLKVGVCAGDVTAAHVGGLDGRWLFTLAGEAPAQLSVIDPVLQTGAVIVSREAWPLLMDCCVGHDIDGGPVRIVLAEPGVAPRTLPPAALSPGDESLLRAYVPEVGLARLDAGQAEWIAEIRTTTAAFVRIRGLDDPSGDAADRLQSVALAAQRVVGRYQGWIKEMTTDDKGTTLVVVFGVPPFTHQDDPARGVQCALALASELDSLGAATGIGIATGSAFCGPVGSAKRREFAVLGPHMILASRLAGAARSGTVLCDPPTQEGLRGKASLERLPSHVLKGLPAPVDVYRVRPQGVRAGRSSGFVDRATERAEAGSRLRGVREGKGGVVLIEGEAGIGKSRLIDEWLREARRQGVRALVGAAEEIERATPYHAWRAVFEQALLLEDADPEVRRATLLERLRAEASEPFAPILGQVLSLDMPDNEVTKQFESAARAENTRDLLVRILAGEAARLPLMVVLEDVHWLDSASWALAARAVGAIPSMLLVLATRPEPASVDPETVGRVRDQATVLRLRALGRDDAILLASDRMGATGLAEPVAALLHERTEGNPLFIEQLTYAMRDEGRIVIVDGVAAAASGAQLRSSAIPEDIRRVITSRIDLLPPGEALTTKVASVVGRRFSLRTLMDIYPLPTDEATLRGHLETLARMDLVTPDPSGRELTYVFSHVTTQETAYELMLPAQAAPLHGRVAEWYERTYADDLSPYHVFLAHHWSKAGEPAKAVEQLERAGVQALRSFANEEAIRSLEQASAHERTAGLDVDLPRRARRQLHLGEAYVHLSRYQEGRAHLESGLRLFGRPAPSGRWQEVAWLLAELGKQLLRRLGILRGAREPAGRDREDLIAVLRAYERLAEASYYDRSRLVPLYCVIRILNAAEASGIPDEISRGLAGTGALFGVVPLPRVAEWYIARARRMLERAQDVATHEIVGIVLAYYDIGAARWEMAREQLERVREASRRIGDRRRYDDAVSNLLELECIRGSFRPGLALASDLLTSAKDRNDPRFQAEALGLRAYCLLQLGNSADAMASLVRVKDLGLDVPIDVRIKVAGVLAMTHLERGERQHAIATADEAARLMGNERPAFYGTFAGYVGPAEVDLALCESRPELPELLARAKGSIARLRAYASVFPVGRPRAALLDGRYRWLRGDRRGAVRMWQRAIAEAERLDMPFERGLAHGAIAQHLDASDPARSRHLAEARAILREIGASRALASLDAPTPGA